MNQSGNAGSSDHSATHSGRSTEETRGAAATLDLGAVFELHQARLFRLALRLCFDREDAKDLLQETFLRVARNPESLPTSPAKTGAPNASEAWLVTVMVNLCRDQQRKRAVRKRHPAEEIPSANPKAPPNPEQATVANSSVHKALSKLSPQRRAIVALRDLEQLPTKEVAKLLQVSVVTVRWHHAAAMRQLKTLLAREDTTNAPSINHNRKHPRS